MVAETETGNIPHLIKGLEIDGRPAMLHLEHSRNDASGFGVSVVLREELDDGTWSVSTPVAGSTALRALFFDVATPRGVPTIAVGVNERKGESSRDLVRFLFRSGGPLGIWRVEHEQEIASRGGFEQHLALVVLPDADLAALVPDDPNGRHGSIFFRRAGTWEKVAAEITPFAAVDLMSATALGGEAIFMASSAFATHLGRHDGERWRFENVYSGWGKVTTWRDQIAYMTMSNRNNEEVVVFRHQNEPGGAWLTEEVARSSALRGTDILIHEGRPLMAFFSYAGRAEDPPYRLRIVERTDGVWQEIASFPGHGDDWLQAADLFTVRGVPHVAFIDERSKPGHRVHLVRGIAPSSAFVRSDSNGDGRADIADPIWLLSDLFGRGPPTPCLDAADANDDARLDLADVVFMISYHLRAGARPPNPFPDCGADGNAGSLGCVAYGNCD